MAREKIIAGNWKMYKTGKEASDYIAKLAPLVKSSKVSVLLSVPYTAIAHASKASEKTNIIVGAQNINDSSEGAFTGEIAGIMLRDSGAEFVIVGHSERRQYFHETDDFINRKVIRALKDDMDPILCVGETAKEHEKGKRNDVLEKQVVQGLKGVPKAEAERLIIAYEPVWAIGTGKTATPELAQEAHKVIRDSLAVIFGKTKAAIIPILYGGSVKPHNIKELLKQKDIDGALVGGASLDPETFAEIIKNSQGK